MDWKTRIAPMKAVVEPVPPNDGTWSSELKWDGMRLMAHVGDDSLILRSGSGRDVTTAFPELASLRTSIAAGSVLDGEGVVMTETGPSFRALQHRIHVAQPSSAQLARYPVNFVAFDLLWFDHHNVMPLPFATRRNALEQSFEPGDRWSVSPLSEDDPEELFQVALDRNLEGIVCKRRDSIYLPGSRSSGWRKVKIRPRTDMVVGGWIPGSGSLANTIGSVVVGVAGLEGFDCAGSVGSGLTDAARRRLSKAFVPRADSPFLNTEVVTRGTEQVRWVEPTVVVEVGFARWDRPGPLWQPTFHGIRVDTDPLATEYRGLQ